ncbi:MAG TPA: hypothetical protein VFM45_11620, partial [Anaeromyxobacteraceae bacterium]|nr:hypothetical protein [Anaeromyxobacteraceae bacterium]
TRLVRVLMIGVFLSTGLAAVTAAAAEQAAGKAAAAGLKVGDTVHVCGCGAGCHCGSMKAEAGKCGCGKALVPAKVTKIEGDQVTVDRGGQPGETTFKAAYRCGCGAGCHCDTVAMAPGKCHCGKDLVKVN